MALRRRALLGVLGAGCVAAAGCVEATGNVASGCASRPPDDATSPAEVRRSLPDYESEPADREERNDRADEIQTALDEALEGHPWLCNTARRMEDGEVVVVVNTTCRPRARRYVPGATGGVGIVLDQTTCPAVQLA